MLYAGDGQGRLSALDRKSGKLLWSFRTGSSVHSSPTPTGNLVIVGSADAGGDALRVEATRAGIGYQTLIHQLLAAHVRRSA